MVNDEWAEGDLMPVWYMEMVQAFDIVTTDCVVGQMKVSDCWIETLGHGVRLLGAGI